MKFDELTQDEQERTRGYILLALDELGITPPPGSLRYLFSGYDTEQAQRRDQSTRQHKATPPEAKAPKPGMLAIMLRYYKQSCSCTNGDMNAAIWSTYERLKAINDPEQREITLDADVRRYFREHPEQQHTEPTEF